MVRDFLMGACFLGASLLLLNAGLLAAGVSPWGNRSATQDSLEQTNSEAGLGQTGTQPLNRQGQTGSQSFNTNGQTGGNSSANSGSTTTGQTTTGATAATNDPPVLDGTVSEDDPPVNGRW